MNQTGSFEPVWFTLGLESSPLDLWLVFLDQSYVPQASLWSRIHMCVGLGLSSVLDFVFTYFLTMLTLLIDVYTTVGLKLYEKIPKKIVSVFLVILIEFWCCLHIVSWLDCVEIFLCFVNSINVSFFVKIVLEVSKTCVNFCVINFWHLKLVT
jgi:hypothetical protein